MKAIIYFDNEEEHHDFVYALNHANKETLFEVLNKIHEEKRIQEMEE